VAIGTLGLTGAFASGIVFGVQKGQLRRLREVEYRTHRLEEIELRVKRAKIGLGVSVVAMVGGAGLALYGAAASICIGDPCSVPASATAALATGFVLSLGGLGGTIASAVLLRKGKRDLYWKPRRVQWDLAQSRVVF